MIFQKKGMNEMEFKKEYIQKAIESLGFTELTDVQLQGIPLLRGKNNVIVEAKTGSGKTHTYLIPVFEKLDETLKEVQMIIIAPTRELASQIFAFAKEVSSFSPTAIDIRLYLGGKDRQDEMARLEKSQPQIVIGTPGRLFDLIRKENVLKAYTAKMLVLDEADMALEDAFLESIDGIASVLNESAQMIVVSATIHEEIQPFLKKYFKNPEVISVDKEEISSLNIKHYFLRTKERDRFDVLQSILNAINPFECIIFCNTKESAESVAAYMNSKKYNSVLVTGDIPYRKRKQLLLQIKDNKYQYIVATDILSRGIDIDGLSHIINYELPKDDSFYIHRSGRTGRMNYDGIAISLYDFDDEKYVNRLEKKGLKCEFIQIRQREIVPAKAHNERNKRVVASSVKREIQRTLPKTNDVKPGYKKKRKVAVEKIMKKAARKGHR